MEEESENSSCCCLFYWSAWAVVEKRQSYILVVYMSLKAIISNASQDTTICLHGVINSMLSISKLLFSGSMSKRLKVHIYRFENFTICSGSYKNNTLKISHS